MEGPTPVSALIHAATMVTAGVYMVTRTNAIYQLAPAAMAVVAMVGAVTALFAASMGVVQNDIKKVLAYSTVSQLGYMFLACGVGAFTAGIFHLMTHAFFKGLLFLAAGSVIHALSGEQDMRKMGALSKKIPITYWTMLIATLAIAGIFPFAGFLSKDLILGKAYEKDALALGHRLLHRRHDGLLHVPADFHDVSWPIARGPRSGASHSRIAALDACSAWYSCRSFDRRRLGCWPEILGGNSAFIRFLEPVVAGAARIARRSRAGSQLARRGNLLMLLSEGLVVCGILARVVSLHQAHRAAGSRSRIASAGSIASSTTNITWTRFTMRCSSIARKISAWRSAPSTQRNRRAGVNGAGWLTRFISKVSMWWDTWIVDGSVKLRRAPRLAA